MSLKLAKNQRSRSPISAATQCSAEDDLPKLQHGAERSAFAVKIHGGWMRNRAKNFFPLLHRAQNPPSRSKPEKSIILGRCRILLPVPQTNRFESGSDISSDFL